MYILFLYSFIEVSTIKVGLLVGLFDCVYWIFSLDEKINANKLSFKLESLFRLSPLSRFLMSSFYLVLLITVWLVNNLSN